MKIDKCDMFQDKTIFVGSLVIDKNTKESKFIRINSNYIKTALRIISLLGDTAIFIYYQDNSNETICIESDKVTFEIAGVWY